MKKTGYILTLLFLYFIPAQGTGKDTTAVQTAIAERLSPLLAFGEAAFGNPALQPYAFATSFSSLRLAGEYRQEKEAVVVQLGDGYRHGMFKAESYLRLNPKVTLWGNAGYRFGKTTSVGWNETSDFELLYPYVMADTAGGDLNTESYTFCGGYSRNNGRFSWGISGDYRATIEYRKTDPRPRNIVSDLKLAGGAACRLTQRYIAGAGIYGRIYRQRNEISFFSDRGASKVYQMLGMGMYNTRFSDGNTGLQYDGGSIGAGIDLIPRNRQGFFISARFYGFSVERTMLAHNYLPLTRLNEKTLSACFGWRKSGNHSERGIQLEGVRHHRQGTEFIYGDGSSSNYPKINDLEQYDQRRAALLLSGLGGWGNRKHRMLWIGPRAGLHSVKTGYVSPSLSFENSRYQGGAVLTILQAIRTSVLKASASADYFGQLSGQLDIASLTSGELIRISVRQQYESLTSESVRYELSLSWSRPFSETLALSADARWRHGRFHNGNRSDQLEIGCRLIF